jgi:N-dimethylarginine dimethylaminohydrolase
MPVKSIVEPSTLAASAFGGHTMTGRLKCVMVRRPAAPATASDWTAFGYLHPVDHQRALEEHAALVDILEQEAVEVVLADGDESGNLDAIFSYDSSLTTNAGAILLRMGKPLRAGEPAFHARTYEDLGVPVAGEIVPPGMIEGGDTLWLDDRTLAVGRGYRTNAEGIQQLRSILNAQGVSVLTYDLPSWNDPGECLHLLSLVSPIAPGAALVHKPLMAVALLDELARRDWTLFDIEPSEFDSMACNVLCLEPWRVLAVNVNPLTRKRLENAGCAVLEYTGDEISHNRSGGPTCLTRPLLRESDEMA